VKAKDVIEISSDGESQDEDADMEDEFAGFDVTPEEKEFLSELLDVAPWEEVMEITGKARRITSQSVSDIIPAAETVESIKNFAAEHPFREKGHWTKAELQEYKDDVYGFATAAGMSKFQADLEVKKATGAWKSERGLPLDNDHELVPEKVKQGRFSEFVKGDPSPGSHKKRKHELLVENTDSSTSVRGSHRSPESEDVISMDTRSDDRGSVREAKRQRNAEKKARRKVERKAKIWAKKNGLLEASQPKASGSQNHRLDGKAPVLSIKESSSALANSSPPVSQIAHTAETEAAVPRSSQKNPPEAQKPKLQSSQSYYVGEEISPLPNNKIDDNISLSATDEKKIGQQLKKKRREKVEKKKLKKKAKLGPKKSEYFAKSKPSGLPFSTTLKDDIEPTPRAKGVEGHKPQNNYGEEMEQSHVATNLLAKAAKARHGGQLDKIKKMAEDAKRAVKNAPVLVKDTTAESKTVTSSNKSKLEPIVEKKKNRNHKRQRNKNRLPEQLFGENKIAENAMIEDEDEARVLPPKEKSYDPSRNSGLDVNVKKGSDANIIISKESIMGKEICSNPSGDQNISRSIPNSGGSNGRPTKRRDRGRKSKSKKKDLEMPNAGESVVAEPAVVDPNAPLESIEPSELSGKKKRKRSKSKSKQDNIKSGEISEPEAVEPLTELADNNSKKSKKGRHGHTHKRAMSVDAMDLDSRTSNQSSKAHHSQ